VGAGWIAATHAATIAALDGVRLVASADPVPDRGNYSDWRLMLERERLDAVLICTPPDTHRDPAVAAAAAGLAVYLEKPVAHTLGDATAIAAAVATAGTICAVGYQYRAIDFLHRLPTGAALLLGTGISETVDRPWLGDPARGGSMLLERASHLIDLERALAGEVAVVASMTIGDAAAVTLHFESGALGSVVIGRAAGPGWRLELIGEGTVTLELDPRFEARGPGLELVHRGQAPIVRSLAAFLEAVRRDDPGRVFCPLREGVATLAVTLAAQEAADRGSSLALAAMSA
jgi:predicted dehydrogenase